MPFIVSGKYLVCNEGTNMYSKIKILTSLNCLVVEGVGKGQILSLPEWDIMVENNFGAMCLESDNCEGCPSYQGECIEKIPDIEECAKPIKQRKYKPKKLSLFFRLITCCALD